MAPGTAGPRRTALQRRIDRLYAAPRENFVALRTALVRELKQRDAADDAESVRRLAKPGLAAWAVNQVYWYARPSFDRLVRAGRRLRDLQPWAASPAEGKALQQAISRRRAALAAAVDAATTALRQAGHPASGASLRRIESNLEAIAAGTGDEVLPGRWVRDLDPPGFDALLGGPPAAGTAPRRRRSSPAAAREDRASRLREELGSCQRQFEQARAQRRRADKRRRSAERSCREAAQRAETARRALDRAREAARRAEAARDEARQQAEEAARQEARHDARVALARTALSTLERDTLP